MNTKRNWRILLLSATTLFVTGVATEAWSGQGSAKNQGGNSPTLSTLEETHLLFMREEEKLARDAYRTFYDCSGAPIFSNISGSEQQHMDSLAKMIVNYGLEDPVVDDSPGVFGNSILSELYFTLVANCEESLAEMLYAGGYIEEIDMIDLQEAIDHTTHSDLIGVYDNLMRGSRNHLRSFVGQYEALGLTYIAQELTQAEVDAIVDQPTERGGPRNKGR